MFTAMSDNIIKYIIIVQRTYVSTRMIKMNNNYELLFEFNWVSIKFG